MSNKYLDEIGVSWRPDGVGLGELLDLVSAVNEKRIHLRLSPSNGCHPVTACHGGLGEWWTGVGSEVTCGECLVWVHA